MLGCAVRLRYGAGVPGKALHVGRRSIFNLLGRPLQCILASPAGELVCKDSMKRVALFEEQRQHGIHGVKYALNKGLETLELPLHVEALGSKQFDDMSQTGLKKRLAALKVEVKLIESYIENGLTTSSPMKKTPMKTNTSAEQVESESIGEAGAVIEEGEEYIEVNALTRRLKKWYTVDACTTIPYEMISSFELYPQWMPFCQDGKVLSTHPAKGVTGAAITFGINVPLIGTMGETIDYQVMLDPPSQAHGAARVYTVSQGSKYMEKLVYDWNFIPIDDRHTKVVLEVEFVALAQWYMPVWEALRKDVIGGVSKAFCNRVIELQASSGGDHGRPEIRPRLHALTEILQGPFQRHEPIVVTEGNGRTIRHANAAFADLVGLPLQKLPGRDIPDLLQSFATDRSVLKGLSAAIRHRISATAVILNQNNAGDEFMNRLTLAPLDDDEKDTGVIFWAILKVVNAADQRLELTTTEILDEAWGPDYQHSQAIRLPSPSLDRKLSSMHGMDSRIVNFNGADMIHDLKGKMVSKFL